MLTRLAIALCLFGAACTSDGYDGARLGGRSLEKELCPTGCSDDTSRALATSREWDQVGEKSYVNIVGEIALDNACDLLPKSGLCASACDIGELGKQVPKGCIDISCELGSGYVIVASACAPEFTTQLTPH